MGKPRLLIISHVLPFPGSAGQQKRVMNTLAALKEKFEITFLTFAPSRHTAEITQQLESWVDTAIVLPSRYSSGLLAKALLYLVGKVYCLLSGLKFSNFLIGKIELNPSRVRRASRDLKFDGVLFEYWHASDCTQFFRERDIPCILDSHDILWKSYERQVYGKQGFTPGWWKARMVARYTAQEEAAWNRFDAIIAINALEYQHIKEKVARSIKMFYTPMGIDLREWRYCAQQGGRTGVVYYGGLASPHNQEAARLVYEKIMPLIWARHPNIEYWIVGSNPPEEIIHWHQVDARVHVTGFVEDVQAILKNMAVMLCPWKGQYGFRSRLIEVMAVGIPVVAMPDAIYGMDLTLGKGVFTADDAEGMAALAVDLLSDEVFWREQSQLAREQMEHAYGFEPTYGALAKDVMDFIRKPLRL